MIALALLATFVLGFTACMVACECEHDGDHRAASSEQCSVDCLCHTVGTLPVDVATVVEANAQQFILQNVPLKLPLVAVSIFNPPKV